MQNINNLRIAFISDQQYPIDKADSEQTMNTVASIATEGLDVSLVIPRKWRNIFRSTLKLKRELIEFYSVDSAFELVELLHFPLTSFRLEKYFHGLIAPIYAAVAGYDIVFTRNPMIALVSLALQKKVIFETYRLYNNKKSMIAKLLAKLTNNPNLAGIMTHSECSRNALIKLGVHPQKIDVMHNGFNPKLLMPRLSKIDARKQLNWDFEAKIACYTGSIQSLKGIETILDVAVRTPEVNYYFIGKYRQSSKNWFEAEISKRGLNNVKKYDWVQQKELSTYLYAADFLVIPPAASPLLKFGKTVLPIKLFIYLAAGRPILAPELPDSRSILNAGNAVLVEPDNIEQAAAAVRKIFSDETWALSLSEHALLDSQNLTWACRARKIREFLVKQLRLDDKSVRSGNEKKAAFGTFHSVVGSIFQK